MRKIYTLLTIAGCFGDYNGKHYQHDKGVFLVTQMNDNGKAVAQFVDCIKISPSSSFDASDSGLRGSDPTFDEYGRILGFSHDA